ncbi:MAG: secondary thiamine-phosphate synthase enzyme YjbQ [Candidatus Hadarchaeota archaeon]
MDVFTKEIEFSTNKKREIVDLTNEIVDLFNESGIQNGIMVAQLPHATSMLVLNESESGVKQDLLDKLDDLVPPQGGYRHDRIDNNAHSHIKAALVGSSKVLPIANGKLQRGTWQNFLVIEQDGPRSRRTMVITIMGE